MTRKRLHCFECRNLHRPVPSRKTKHRVRRFNHAMRKKNHHLVREISSSRELTILTFCNHHRRKRKKRRKHRVRRFNHAIRKKNHHLVREISSSRELTILTDCNHHRRNEKIVLDGSTMQYEKRTITSIVKHRRREN